MATIADFKKAYAAAAAKGDKQGMANAHAGAEGIRNNSGYSGGADGSQNIKLPSSGSSGNSSSKKTNSSDAYVGAGSYSGLNDFYAANASRINGIANANGVDASTARAMLIANINGNGNYAGGGVADMPALSKSYQAALSADNSATRTASNPYYNEAKELYDDQLAEQQRALQKQIDSTVSGINAQKDTAQKTYEQQMREAYIANEQNKLGMGDYLTANGYTGGMAETTLANINNQYMNNRMDANSELNTALSGYNQLINQAKVSGNSDLVNLANTYTNNLASALEKQQAYDHQSAQDAQSQSNYENEQASKIWAMYVAGEIPLATAQKALTGTVYGSYLPSNEYVAPTVSSTVLPTVSAKAVGTTQSGGGMGKSAITTQNASNKVADAENTILTGANPNINNLLVKSALSQYKSGEISLAQVRKLLNYQGYDTDGKSVYSL